MKTPSLATVAVLGLATLACQSDTPYGLDSSPLFAHVAGVATGQARLHPVNQSGITGRISFTDDGVELTINGTATGLAPGTPYASLIYDNRSVSGGPEACEPGIFDSADPDFLLPTMFVGVWANFGDGSGTLSEVNIFDEVSGTRVYVSLDKFRTISIRDLTVPGPFGPGTGPDAVVACGEVGDHPAR